MLHNRRRIFFSVSIIVRVARENTSPHLINDKRFYFELVESMSVFFLKVQTSYM